MTELHQICLCIFPVAMAQSFSYSVAIRHVFLVLWMMSAIYDCLAFCVVAGQVGWEMRIAVQNLLSTRRSYAILWLVTSRRILMYFCLRWHRRKNSDFTATICRSCTHC